MHLGDRRTGGGWVYAPDYYPSGELLFQTGAGSNSGSYSDKKNDTLIHDTKFGDATLAACQNYLAKQLPVVWQPNAATRHRDPEGPARASCRRTRCSTINPENWYFTK